MNTVNNAFVDYVTSGAFNLNLSRRQIDALKFYACHEQFIYTPSRSSQVLVEKGLIEQVPQEEAHDKNYGCMRITEEGKLVWELIKRAGLAVELPPSVFIPAPTVDFVVQLKEPAHG